MRLKIVQAGEAVLRRRARELLREEILHPRMQELIAWMRETLHDAPGVGLAAPQVGLGVQLAVIEDPPGAVARLSPEQAAERHRSAVPFHVIINPTLTLEAGETPEFFEGCLSVAGFSAIVPRAERVRVECLNEKAEAVSIAAEGWYARILQHEIDHLHGTLYLDRMKPRSFCTTENHLRFWSAKTVADFWREAGEAAQPG